MVSFSFSPFSFFVCGILPSFRGLFLSFFQRWWWWRGKKRERTGEVFQHSLFFRVCISKNREMASRFDSSSSGSSEDEEEAPQLDGMTSSEDQVFEDAFGDVYDDLDAGELEVRAMRRRASERRRRTFHWPAKQKQKLTVSSTLYLSLSLLLLAPGGHR